MSVQKYVLSKDEAGFVLVVNKVAQNLHDAEALGLWVYLASLPPNWVFYKDQIRAHFNIGREKLNKLLSVLKKHRLITVEMSREGKGRFAHAVFHVHNGENFAQDPETAPALNKEQNAPCTENPLTVNQSPVTDSYKDIDKKKKGIKETDINNISATDVTHENEPCSFDEFWNIYPIKKNKIRARKIWERKKLNKIAELICNDVSHRQVNDPSWADEQFIPHPSTYLQNERWNDAVTQCTHKQHVSKNSGGDALSRVFKKHTANQGATYDQHGNAVNPLR